MGVSLILGNDLTGDNVLAVPVVVSSHVVSDHLDKLQYLDTVPVCAATRAMTKKPPQRIESNIDLSDAFLAKGDILRSSDWFSSCEEENSVHISSDRASMMMDS